MATKDTQLEIANELLSRSKAQESFYEFAKQAWRYVEGDRPFVDGWHIKAICDHLEAVVRTNVLLCKNDELLIDDLDVEGYIRNLIINQPPRTMKSTLCSVMLCAWVWISWPEKQFLYVSYALSLAIRDSVKCRRLIESTWYQRRWGHIFKMVGDQNTKTRFDNDKAGYRMSSSINAQVTGDGADFCICLPFDSLITTDKGKIPIGKIVEESIDCKILSYNHELNKTEYKEIEKYEINPGRKLLIIDLGDQIIECTEEHPIFIEGKGYIEAKNIQEGDVVLCL